MRPQLRVWIIDDEKQLVPLLVIYVEKWGGVVVRTSFNREESSEGINHLEEDGTNLALVDGNAVPGVHTGQDGVEVCEEIQNARPLIVTVGISGDDKMEHGDIQLYKPFTFQDFSEVLDRVAELLSNPDLATILQQMRSKAK